jgi:prevent-host-death family protein
MCTLHIIVGCTGTAVAEVGITQLRRELKDWLERVRAGDEVVITDRGEPVARLSAIDAAPLLDQLRREGRVTAPSGAPRLTARGRKRVTATGDVADLVVTERDARR